MSAAAFIKTINHPFKFRLFLLTKLPSAYFAGVRVREASESRCVVTVPYKWFSRNPFRSTYFACLSMAAEMSTGALAMAHLYKRKPAVSMLVTKVESSYHKKAAPGFPVTRVRCWPMPFNKASTAASRRNCAQDRLGKMQPVNW
jgi:hypothetical protein